MRNNIPRYALTSLVFEYQYPDTRQILGFQISNLYVRFRISDLRLRISDFGFQISDFEFQISNIRFRISYFGFHISDFEHQISNFSLFSQKFMFHKFWFSIVFYEFLQPCVFWPGFHDYLELVSIEQSKSDCIFSLFSTDVDIYHWYY